MNRKRLVRRNFSFMWDGIIHLEDGGRWYLSDPARRRDVTWWETGEQVELVRNRGSFLLLNVLRGESVSVVEDVEGELKLAA